ncbi:hypothetical protein [Natronohydrobacter thiooxidans]|uniref:hypothetical protein n=1 Tax=Natronohydrobacter thiooxidans TaxID=87172 RepID=UPI0015875DB8|nr:hypothetical protein [Natronohydrobacter thiooxidans]
MNRIKSVAEKRMLPFRLRMEAFSNKSATQRRVASQYHQVAQLSLWVSIAVRQGWSSPQPALSRAFDDQFA